MSKEVSISATQPQGGNHSQEMHIDGGTVRPGEGLSFFPLELSWPQAKNWESKLPTYGLFPNK